MSRCFSIVLAACVSAFGSVTVGHAQTVAPMSSGTHQEVLPAPVSAQDIPKMMAEKRQVLSEQREVIMQNFNRQQDACWQKFAVNACLIDVRRLRRQALDLLTPQELALNEQERLWRTQERDRRVLNKQPDPSVSP